MVAFAAAVRERFDVRTSTSWKETIEIARERERRRRAPFAALVVIAFVTAGVLILRRGGSGMTQVAADAAVMLLGQTAGILQGYLDAAVGRVAGTDPARVGLVRSVLKLMIQSGGTRRFVSLDEIRRALPDVPDDGG